MRSKLTVSYPNWRKKLTYVLKNSSQSDPSPLYNQEPLTENLLHNLFRDDVFVQGGGEGAIPRRIYNMLVIWLKTWQACSSFAAFIGLH